MTPFVLFALLQVAPEPVAATLADVAFMAGHWVDRSPARDALVGVLEKGPEPQEFVFRRRGVARP
ncbi:MAG TPA: hypothetical protein VFM88_13665 [Vicinamibacteria bacterium]|nr:hypothetical protein [Vicinamibacteria bacterium]